MADQTPVSAQRGVLSRSWPEIVLGFLLGLFVAHKLHVDGSGAWVFGCLGVLLFCLISSAITPLRRCWLCKGRKWVTDGRGNMRQRPCLRCNRERIVRRPLARLMGIQGRRIQ